MEENLVEMVPNQEAPVSHEVILANDEPEMPQPRLYHALMRDYEESPSRMMDDLDDLDDDPNEGRSSMDEWFPRMEAMIETESSSLSLYDFLI
jgi:hypothetical protein